MAKAKRLLSAQLSKVDLVVELCDARLPLSSRNPALDELIRHKRRVLLLCKADLAEPAKTQRWLAYFRRQGLECMAYDKSPQKTKQARALIELAARDVLERNQRRGIQKTLRAMVVGVPNVGKTDSFDGYSCVAPDKGSIAELLNTYFRNYTGPVDASELNLVTDSWPHGTASTSANVQFVGQLDKESDDAILSGDTDLSGAVTTDGQAAGTGQ